MVWVVERGLPVIAIWSGLAGLGMFNSFCWFIYSKRLLIRSWKTYCLLRSSLRFGHPTHLRRSFLGPTNSTVLVVFDSAGAFALPLVLSWEPTFLYISELTTFSNSSFAAITTSPNNALNVFWVTSAYSHQPVLVYTMNPHLHSILRMHFPCQPHIIISKADDVVFCLLISPMVDLWWWICLSSLW